ncbi:hypothetical protein GCM10009602_28260 [Nocardiopsis tropica]
MVAFLRFLLSWSAVLLFLAFTAPGREAVPTNSPGGGGLPGPGGPERPVAGPAVRRGDGGRTPAVPGTAPPGSKDPRPSPCTFAARHGLSAVVSAPLAGAGAPEPHLLAHR